LLRTLGKPTDAPTATGGNSVLQPHGPAVDIAFENGLQGGRLFGSDSNQATHAHNGQNNSSRIVIIDPQSGAVTPFISNLPTGDHPTEEFAFNGGWIYWSQGSTTNSGVVGLDNGGGQNQPDIPCQDIVLSQNVFDSGNGKKSSGYSPFGVARPSNGAPDAMHIARQNDDGTPDYHGWPDRYGFLASAQHVFDPVGGPSDDLCVFDTTNPPSHCTPASLAKILSEDVPIRNVLDHPPQRITAPLFLEGADSSFTGID